MRIGRGIVSRILVCIIIPLIYWGAIIIANKYDLNSEWATTATCVVVIAAYLTPMVILSVVNGASRFRNAILSRGAAVLNPVIAILIAKTAYYGYHSGIPFSMIIVPAVLFILILPALGDIIYNHHENGYGRRRSVYLLSLSQIVVVIVTIWVETDILIT